MAELAARVRHIYDLHYILSKSNMREFVSSAGFKYTIKDVLADDESNSQFQGEWTKKPLTESLLFSDWKNVWKQLQPVYENEFKTLVFYKLPEIKAIDESMEFIIKSV